jgi:putative SOS response-associated peptidase YedK
MCGRYSFTSPEEAMRQLFGYTNPPPNFPARFNVAPTQDVPVVRIAKDGSRELVLMRWGLVPFWAADPKIGYRCINARVETVATAPAFREAFRQRRCLVVTDGFYEWKKLDRKQKQPYRIVMKSRVPFAMAGVWDRWKHGGERILSCAIVTGPANALVAPIHNRMPVILDPAHYQDWLSGAAGTEVLRPFPPDRMIAYPVSTRVNSTDNDDSSVIEEVRAQETGSLGL